MSMAPVAAAISVSQDASGATKSKIQSIASPGPAMKPSSDIDRFTTTLPVPVLMSLMLFLRRTLGCSVIRSGAVGPPYPGEGVLKVAGRDLPDLLHDAARQAGHDTVAG